MPIQLPEAVIQGNPQENPGTTLNLPELAVHGPGFKAYRRYCVVTVGTIQIRNVGMERGLDVEFEIKTSTTGKEPNTCDLKIYNLSPASRQAIAQASEITTSIAAPAGTKSKIVPVQIDAGYVGHFSTIFLGEMRSGQVSRPDGTDILLELNSGDADQALALARVNQNLPAGSTASSAIQTILKAMGCGVGNLNSATVQQLLKGAKVYQRGVHMKGNAADYLDDLCVSCGLEFSIQGGQAQFLPLGQPLQGEAYLLSAGDSTTGAVNSEEAASNTGLIGTPAEDTKGVLSATSLILPGLRCGGPVQVESVEANGLYKITSLVHKGQTGGNDWYCQIEGLRYNTVLPKKTKRPKI